MSAWLVRKSADHFARQEGGDYGVGDLGSANHLGGGEGGGWSMIHGPPTTHFYSEPTLICSRMGTKGLFRFVGGGRGVGGGGVLAAQPPSHLAT